MEAYNDRSTRPASPTRPTTSRHRRRSRAPASTSASCRSSASPARSTGACTPTTRPAPTASTRATAASSARSATTRPATSSTRSTPPSEDWQPGVSGHPGRALRHRRLRHARRRTPCDADGALRARRRRLLQTGQAAQHLRLGDAGSRPTGCTARDVDGNPLVARRGRGRARPDQETDGECISELRRRASSSAPTPTDQGTPDANFGAAVDGNYGFGDGCFDRHARRHRPGRPACMARRRRFDAAAARATTWCSVDDPRTTRAATRCTR